MTLRLEDFTRMTLTFKQAGLHDPPPPGPFRSRALINPIGIKGRGDNPDVEALLVGNGLWCYWVPRPELTQEQQDEANQDFKERRRT